MYVAQPLQSIAALSAIDLPAEGSEYPIFAAFKPTDPLPEELAVELHVRCNSTSILCSLELAVTAACHQHALQHKQA